MALWEKLQRTVNEDPPGFLRTASACTIPGTGILSGRPTCRCRRRPRRRRWTRLPTVQKLARTTGGVRQKEARKDRPTNRLRASERGSRLHDGSGVGGQKLSPHILPLSTVSDERVFLRFALRRIILILFDKTTVLWAATAFARPLKARNS